MRQHSYEIGTLWVKLTSKIKNKLQTGDWSIMPPAEQPRSAIFESKPVDLKEWETTLIVILLLLMCLITLTKCVSWNEPCKINTQGRRSEAPQGERGVKGEERWHSRVMVLRKWRWEGQSFNQVLPLVPPFHRSAKSRKDQDTNLFKEKHFMVVGTKGKSIHPLAMCGPTPFLQKCTLVPENVMCSGTQQV